MLTSCELFSGGADMCVLTCCELLSGYADMLYVLTCCMC